MSTPNLYWPIYQNLEREFNDLMFDIHIDDNQLNVYSSKISDLILRASIEIESISKELYKLNGGTKTENIKYDEDAIKHLNDLWKLEKKIVIVGSSNAFLSDSKRILKPFEKNENRTGTQRLTYSWNNAYQNIKHDRANSLEFGSIKYLFDSLAALFALNIYFKNQEFLNLTGFQIEDNFDKTMSSIIFSIKLHVNNNLVDNYNKNDDFEECIYLTNFEEQTYKNLSETFDEMNDKININIRNFVINNSLNIGEVEEYFEGKLPEYSEASKLEEVRVQTIRLFVNKMTEQTKALKTNIVLNKNQF